MAITRRELAGLLAAVSAAAAPQEDEETRSAHQALQNDALVLDKIPLPVETQPDFQFKA